MSEVILITEASSGFGALAARALAQAGHVAYASMTDIHWHNAPQVEAVKEYSVQHKVDLRSIELDVTSEASANTVVAAVADRMRTEFLNRIGLADLLSVNTTRVKASHRPLTAIERRF